jgi:hypothetical protein
LQQSPPLLHASVQRPEGVVDLQKDHSPVIVTCFGAEVGHAAFLADHPQCMGYRATGQPGARQVQVNQLSDSGISQLRILMA